MINLERVMWRFK